jgi:hypothetical protein
MWTSIPVARVADGHERGVPKATIVELHREIDARMRRGATFSSVETGVIESSGLSDDEKSALWLYGWSFVDMHAQRREAAAHIAHLAPGAVDANGR